MWLLVIGVAATAMALAIATPSATTPLGTAVGRSPAAGVERFGGLPYALPPLGARRLGRAEVNDLPWPGGVLDATRLGPPCVQNPLGDPRSTESESDAPTEDCLRLNIWRPVPTGTDMLHPVMVYLFGGGLCTGFAASEYLNGSNLVLQHQVLVVTVQYRLGALGFLVGDDPMRPGTGGMNGIHDVIVSLQWLQKYVGAFGGDARDITLFGQSSGAYAVCTLCVAPEAKGLFRRASLLSGPCFGGPTLRGWGPGSIEKGQNVTKQILAATGATTLDDLRRLPAERVQWPNEWMSDKDKAPYFSGYFLDPAVLPRPAEELFREGAINPEELIVSFTSKDGTAAYYGTAPTLGLVGSDANTSTPEGYRSAMLAAWGPDADAVMREYALTAYSSASAACVQADADAYVICPLRRLSHYAALAGRAVWVSEFAHFQPSPSEPRGCSGYGPHGCKGFGCDNGVELDVVPGWHSESSQLWATHGADYRYIFGTESGPDGVGPPNNVTNCKFTAEEASLSSLMMAYWASFARYGNPNAGAVLAAPAWPRATLQPGGQVAVQRIRFSVASTDGVPTGLVDGVREANCDFWDALYPSNAVANRHDLPLSV